MKPGAALKQDEAFSIPVRSGSPGQVVVVMAGERVCQLIKQDEEGRLNAETCDLIDAMDIVLTYLEAFARDGALERTAQLRRDMANVVKLAPR